MNYTIVSFIFLFVEEWQLPIFYHLSNVFLSLLRKFIKTGTFSKIHTLFVGTFTATTRLHPYLSLSLYFIRAFINLEA